MTERFYEFVLGYQRLFGAYISKYFYLRNKKGGIYEDISYISTQQYYFEYSTRPLVFSIVNLVLVYSFLSFRYSDLASLALCLFIQFGSRLFKWISIFSVYFSAKLDSDTSHESSKQSRKVIDADNVETYKHTFVLSQTGFRCLVLKKSTYESSVIECSLFAISITTPPRYEALSYTWGPPPPPSEQQYILCDGKKLPVTENCISALYHLRKKYSNRLLWIDAICIDQTNAEEASQQVQIMGQIYQNAAKVLVWLGPSTAERRLAFRYIALHLQLWSLPRSMLDWSRSHLWEKIERRGHESVIADFSNIAWFSRVWTIQEIGLAQQGVCTIHCGNDTENYDFANAELLSLTTALNVRSAYPLNDLLYHQSTHIFRADLRSRVLTNEPLSRGTIGRLLRYLALYDATNPRDKIYGLYGILAKLGFTMPKPDYTLSVDEVYWKSMVAIVEKEPDLAFLSLASGIDSHIPNAPSWVPDFRKTSSFMCLDGTHCATKESLPVVHIHNRGAELQVSGVIVDRISNHVRQKVWEPPFGTREVCDGRYFGLDDPEMFFSTVSTLQAWMTIALIKDSHARERYNNFYKATLEVATQGHLRLMNCDAKDFADFLDLLHWNSDWYKPVTPSDVQRNLEKAANDPGMRDRFFNPTYNEYVENPEWQTMCAMKVHPKISKILHLVWAVARGNTIFETATGWLGVGANTLMEDDVVALISGMRMPVILRSILGAGERKFMVVGTAYVSGMMDGEAWDEGEKNLEDLSLA
ncbi:heterokaryon incompatibility protein-domain-containing protein [Cadophora sp. MPI-SDFR-AT-0126]|nr:heterokaryon incompatibility protein-domain-containing protein [Leotiomycetes sp. MPI-SDFR-AT-0126]